MNDLCKLLKTLKVPNCPANFYRIKQHLLPKSHESISSLTAYLCSVCCESSTSAYHCSNVNCTQYKNFRTSPLYYLRFSIREQLREILAHTLELNLKQQKDACTNLDFINDIYDAKAYQHIINQERGTNFLTLLMNVDGIQVTKNTSDSLWIFTFVINELKRNERFKLKNVIVGGIVSTVSRPNRRHMQALLSPIVQELRTLEQGDIFKVKDCNQNSNIYLKVFLTASCCDKPAQGLVQGLSESTGAFGCGRCELKGDLSCVAWNTFLSINLLSILGETIAIKANSQKKN